MNIIVNFIRNAVAKSELEGRFLGKLDEPIHPEGERRVRMRKDAGEYPPCELLFCSPSSRCVQTAGIIYPQTPAITAKGLTALDYGDYAELTYSDIVKDARFKDWAGSARLQAYPGGEEPHVFMARCAKAFQDIMREARSKKLEQVSMVIHLSVMQALFQRYCVPRSNYHDWQADHGGGYTVACGKKGDSFTVLKKI